MKNPITKRSVLASAKRAFCNVATAALLAMTTTSGVEAASSQVVYFHTDALGSPTAAFNASGEVCWRETYSPYGEKLEHNDWMADPASDCGYLGTDRGYTGHVQDDGGLVYAQQRYYDPTIGRFMSIDPVSAVSGDPRLFGRYHYGGNNPYKYTDPDGQLLFSAGAVLALWVASDIILPAVLSTEYSNGQVVSAGFPLDAGAALGGVKAGIRSANAVRSAAPTTTIVNSGENAVYQSVNASGQVDYVGITKSLESRAAAHLREKGISIDSIPGLSNLSRTDARAVEQVLIEAHGLRKNGGTLINKINSIAERNPIYAGSLTRGAELLNGVGYPGF